MQVNEMLANNSVPADKATNHPNKIITVECAKKKLNTMS